MRAVVLALAFILTLTSTPLRAAELLMFEEDWCTWCERWNDEVGVVYHKTAEGKRAPLRRIDVHARIPDDVQLKTRVQFTPTFVLVEDGREIARIEGYPGEDFFWGLLQQMLEKLPKPEQRAGAGTRGPASYLIAQTRFRVVQ